MKNDNIAKRLLTSNELDWVSGGGCDEECDHGSVLPFEKPGDCEHFYQCEGGILYTMPCAAGTVFNPQLRACDWPFNVPGCM